MGPEFGLFCLPLGWAVASNGKQSLLYCYNFGVEGVCGSCPGLVKQQCPLFHPVTVSFLLSIATFHCTMTAYHAFNCVALAFGPYALLWYLINEDNILSLVIWSGLFYAVTQIIVILLLATFLTEPEVDNDFVVLHELGRTLISVVNIGAIYMALITKQARITARHLRILGVGFGWATANCLLSVAGPLIYSAGSNEFNWENPMKASKFCSDCGVPFVCNLLCFKTREYDFLTRFVFFYIRFSCQLYSWLHSNFVIYIGNRGFC